MKTLVAALLLLAPAAQAELDFEDLPYDERPDVLEITKTPEIKLEKKTCFDEQVRLGLVCVKPLEVPAGVTVEVETMLDQQMDNESDYDVRITQVVVVDSGALSFNLEEAEFASIALALGIPKDAEMTLSLSPKGWDLKEYFGGLYIDGQLNEDTATLDFLTKHLKGPAAVIFDFQKNVDLYPGGGIYGKWFVILQEDQLVFFKVVGWDS